MFPRSVTLIAAIRVCLYALGLGLIVGPIVLDQLGLVYFRWLDGLYLLALGVTAGLVAARWE